MYDLSRVPTRDAPWITDEQHGAIRRSIQKVPPGYVKLFHPRLRGLTFGRMGNGQRGADEANIRFGVVEPHFALVKASHVALDPTNPNSIWRRDKFVVLVAEGEPVQAGETIEADDANDSGDGASVAPRVVSRPRTTARRTRRTVK